MFKSVKGSKSGDQEENFHQPKPQQKPPDYWKYIILLCSRSYHMPAFVIIKAGAVE
jgi:hypothetical protein